MCGRLMSPAHETQSMREIRLLRGRLPRKGGGLSGMTKIMKWSQEYQVKSAPGHGDTETKQTQKLLTMVV